MSDNEPYIQSLHGEIERLTALLRQTEAERDEALKKASEKIAILKWQEQQDKEIKMELARQNSEHRASLSAAQAENTRLQALLAPLNGESAEIVMRELRRVKTALAGKERSESEKASR